MYVGGGGGKGGEGQDSGFITKANGAAILETHIKVDHMQGHAE